MYMVNKFSLCVCDVVKDAGKEEYLRPFIRVGLDRMLIRRVIERQLAGPAV